MNNEVKATLDNLVNIIVDKYIAEDTENPYELFFGYRSRFESEYEGFKKDFWYVDEIVNEDDIIIFSEGLENMVDKEFINLDLIKKDPVKAKEFWAHVDWSEEHKEHMIVGGWIGTEDYIEAINYLLEQVDERLAEFVPYKRTLEEYASKNNLDINEIKEVLTKISGYDVNEFDKYLAAFEGKSELKEFLNDIGIVFEEFDILVEESEQVASQFWTFNHQYPQDENGRICWTRNLLNWLNN